jgi:hypothetical protein
MRYNVFTEDKISFTLVIDNMMLPGLASDINDEILLVLK